MSEPKHTPPRSIEEGNPEAMLGTGLALYRVVVQRERSGLVTGYSHEEALSESEMIWDEADNNGENVGSELLRFKDAADACADDPNQNCGAAGEFMKLSEFMQTLRAEWEEKERLRYASEMQLSLPGIGR